MAEISLDWAEYLRIENQFPAAKKKYELKDNKKYVQL